MTDKTSTKSFASFSQNMSLWEVAHRWAGHHPESTSADLLPVEVQDILKAMMDAQNESDLWVALRNGYILKDWTYIRSWTDYVPYDSSAGNEENDQDSESDDRSNDVNLDGNQSTTAKKRSTRINAPWDGSDEHKRELYLRFMSNIVEPHDQHIHRHSSMIAGDEAYDRDYLEDTHVQRNNLAEWALASSLPFPDFWFSEDERETEKLITARFKEYEDSGEAITDELYEKIIEEFDITDDPQLENLMLKPGRVNESDIDEFWNRLADKQKCRILCRAMAASLWDKDQTLTIAAIIKDPLIQDQCGAKYYTGKDTIRNWIKDLDPRPEDSKRGRPSSK